MARFCPLFSGSSGNCLLVGGSGGNILVDVGVNAKAVEGALAKIDVEPSAIRAIFVTHEHTDHIAGLSVFASRYGITVYASAGTLEFLEEKGLLRDGFESRVIEKTGVEEAGMYIMPFNTSHDSRESMGFRIHTQDDRKIAVATDLGCMTGEVREGITGCDLVMLESNHDIRMLENSSYPYYLKKRILSAVGHLSNDDCAAELCRLAENGTTRFFLAHLSLENNHPALAFQSALCSLTQMGLKQGIDFELAVAPRCNSEKVTVF